MTWFHTIRYPEQTYTQLTPSVRSVNWPLSEPPTPPTIDADDHDPKYPG